MKHTIIPRLDTLQAAAGLKSITEEAESFSIRMRLGGGADLTAENQ